MLEMKKKHYEVLANKLIDKFALRNIEGYYVDSKEDVLPLLKEKFFEEGKTVCTGGSMTLKETGVMDYLTSSDCVCTFIDRMAPKTEEETKEVKAKMVNADYFLMSSNAITLDGELVNIDGYANRVSFLCYGPDNVIIVAGMNKMANDVNDAYNRIKTYACSPNTIRLNKNTPCANNGRCGNCFVDDCICSQIVVTRRSGVKGRIKVILVGEDLGF